MMDFAGSISLVFVGQPKYDFHHPIDHFALVVAVPLHLLHFIIILFEETSDVDCRHEVW